MTEGAYVDHCERQETTIAMRDARACGSSAVIGCNGSMMHSPDAARSPRIQVMTALEQSLDIIALLNRATGVKRAGRGLLCTPTDRTLGFK
ncbi:hypothetical protein B7486_05090 [cyanobacterium TDX16]|nr:hypothetical protein B7486_05090 [cyanobacterium TDX16]